MVLLEMPGIEPGAFHMQSERATTALHPLVVGKQEVAKIATSELPSKYNYYIQPNLQISLSMN